MKMVDLTAWAGKEDVSQGHVGGTMAAMLAATFNHAEAPGTGAVLPLLWHWCAFLPTVPMDALAMDGHPALGGFLPPVPLERRMWAAGELTFIKPLHVGEALTRHSRIEAVTEKSGATGDMVFVTVSHEIAGEEGLAIRETQDIVYLAIPDSFTPPAKRDLPEGAAVGAEVPVNEALLFRYSACTFNAHRIHIDLPYAQQVEHYPGLVVHGPLQATKLIEAAALAAGRAPDHFKFRGVHPLFHDEGLHLRGAWDAENARQMRLWAGSGAGHQTMQAHATWEDNQ